MEQQKLQQIQIEQLQKQIDEFVEAEAAAAAAAAASTSTSSITTATIAASATTNNESSVESAVLNENDLNQVLNNLSETLVKTKQQNADNIE